MTDAERLAMSAAPYRPQPASATPQRDEPMREAFDIGYAWRQVQMNPTVCDARDVERCLGSHFLAKIGPLVSGIGLHDEKDEAWAKAHATIRTALARLTAHLSAPEQAATVPEGWVLVPIEPTEEMVQAAYDERLATVSTVDHALKLYTTVGVHFHPGHDWRAMLAAVPSAPAVPAQPEPTDEALVERAGKAIHAVDDFSSRNIHGVIPWHMLTVFQQNKYHDFATAALASLRPSLSPGEREVVMPQSDANDLDDVVRALGIEDSFTTPAEAVRELKAEIERLRSAPERQQAEWLDADADSVRGGPQRQQEPPAQPAPDAVERAGTAIIAAGYNPATAHDIARIALHSARPDEDTLRQSLAYMRLFTAVRGLLNEWDQGGSLNPQLRETKDAMSAIDTLSPQPKCPPVAGEKVKP